MQKQLKEETEVKDGIIEKQNKKISLLRKQRQRISGLEGRGAEHRTYLGPTFSLLCWTIEICIMVLCRSITADLLPIDGAPE